MLPDLTPATRLGQAGVAAYAARQGMDAAAFLASRGPALTTDQVGTEIADLISDPARDDGAYPVNAAGTSPVP